MPDADTSYHFPRAKGALGWRCTKRKSTCHFEFAIYAHFKKGLKLDEKIPSFLQEAIFGLLFPEIFMLLNFLILHDLWQIMHMYCVCMACLLNRAATDLSISYKYIITIFLFITAYKSLCSELLSQDITID